MQAAACGKDAPRTLQVQKLLPVQERAAKYMQLPMALHKKYQSMLRNGEWRHTATAKAVAGQKMLLGTSTDCVLREQDTCSAWKGCFVAATRSTLRAKKLLRLQKHPAEYMQLPVACSASNFLASARRTEVLQRRRNAHHKCKPFFEVRATTCGLAAHTTYLALRREIAS